jgi:uncharacterized repeat protein (TIGR03803 family)
MKAANNVFVTLLLGITSAAILLPQEMPAQGIEQRIFSFAYAGGAQPNGVVMGSDGSLYGTTAFGGTDGFGTVFQLYTNGTCNVLHPFGVGASEIEPNAPVIQGSDGFLYGTTPIGGAHDSGVVFKVSTNGTGYSAVYSFNYDPSGGGPSAALVQGSDGTLYGTTPTGGTNAAAEYGTVFKLSTNGMGFTVLHTFTGPDGEGPEAGLILGSDGALYGTTQHGGTNDSGTVFHFVSQPILVTQPQSLVVSPGGSASFSVVASGVPAPGYQWQFNGVNLTNGAGVSGANASTLVVSGVGAANVGGYDVVVTNAYGSVTSDVATLALGMPGELLLGRLPDLNWQLSFLPPLSGVCDILASTDLSNWITLTNFSTTTNPVFFEDASSTNYPYRFYRAVWSQ